METVTSSRYPRGVVTDFRVLDVEALQRCLKHYGVVPRSGASHAELATALARAFEAHSVDDEEELIAQFCGAGYEQHSHKHSSSAAAAAAAAAARSRDPLELLDLQRQLDAEPARPGEQVAAKVNKYEENGAWILANVLDYHPEQEVYDVQDEDDVTRVLKLKRHEVHRLSDTAHYLEKGDRIVAVFPDTTSFYRAVVSKVPKTPNSNGLYEVIVKFEDDEDESGRTPHRRVPARFVMPRPDEGR